MEDTWYEVKVVSHSSTEEGDRDENKDEGWDNAFEDEHNSKDKDEHDGKGEDEKDKDDITLRHTFHISCQDETITSKIYPVKVGFWGHFTLYSHRWKSM